jgi:hypothetical protein
MMVGNKVKDSKIVMVKVLVEFADNNMLEAVKGKFVLDKDGKRLK